MAKKTTLKASKNTVSPTAYIKSLPKEQQKEAKELVSIFKEVTKVAPKMWGTSIIGFGEYHYKYESGREGNFLATGFSMRKSGPTLYIMPGYQDYNDILKDLGPHKLGKSCLYLKNLDDVNLTVMKKLIRAGIKDLKKTHLVTMR